VAGFPTSTTVCHDSAREKKSLRFKIEEKIEEFMSKTLAKN
jgi:hypothetical protein